MPIPFSLLPEHLQILTVQKQNLGTFLVFHECSRESYEIAKKIKTRFVYPIDEAIRPSEGLGGRHRTNNAEDCAYCFDFDGDQRLCLWRSISVMKTSVKFEIKEFKINGNMSTRFCEKLTELLFITQSSIDEITNLNFDRFQCSPAKFYFLLDVSQARKLHFRGDCEIPLKFLKIPAMKRIERFTAVCPNFNDARLLAIKASSIYLEEAPVSNIAVNAILKQCLRGEQEWAIGIRGELKEEEVFRDISYSQLETPGMVFFSLEKEEGKETMNVNFNSPLPLNNLQMEKMEKFYRLSVVDGK